MDIKENLKQCLDMTVNLLQTRQDDYIDVAETAHDFLKSPTVWALHDFFLVGGIMIVDDVFEKNFNKLSSEFFKIMHLHHRQVLKNIANPMEYLKKEAEADGNLLDVKMAIEISNDSNWLKKLAEDGLNVV